MLINSILKKLLFTCSTLGIVYSAQESITRALDVVNHDPHIQDIITGYADHWHYVRQLPFTNCQRPEINNLHFLPGIPVLVGLEFDSIADTQVTQIHVEDNSKITGDDIFRPARSLSKVMLGNIEARPLNTGSERGAEKGGRYYYRTCTKRIFKVDTYYANSYAYSAQKNLIAVAKDANAGVIRLLPASKEPHPELLKPTLQAYINENARSIVIEFLGNITQTILTHRQIPVYSLAFSQNGNYLASGDRAGFLRVHELLPENAGHKRLWKVDIRPKNPKPFDAQAERAEIVKHAGTIYVLLFHRDMLFSASHNGTIQIWDILTGRLISTITQFDHPVISLAISSDGKYLAAGLDDKNKSIELFINSAAQLRKYMAHE